jgi:RHS repeat-associated protein
MKDIAVDQQYSEGDGTPRVSEYPREENRLASPGQAFAVSAPVISLPKGGGAIRGIGEKFTANPVTGTASLSVPIPTSQSRSQLGPSLALTYESGLGNGPFGIGWNLSLPAITRKTDKGLPRYEDAVESDTFILSGAEDLVPVLVETGDGWRRHGEARTLDGVDWWVERYRPRVEGLFARIERWTHLGTGEVHWRSITRDNVTTRYGTTAESRVADPADPRRVFSWLICESYDDQGNAILYRYRAEDSVGVDTSQVHERNRTDATRSADRHLKRIHYGNRTPRQEGEDLSQRTDWMFEVVLDYGEHDAAAPAPDDPGDWLCRRDPFSTYRGGFELRSYRLCQRILMFHHFPGEPGVGADCLVRSTDLTYRDVRDDPDDRLMGHPLGAFLASITQAGYRRANGGYRRLAMPPLELEYSAMAMDETLHEVDEASLAHLPAGVDGRRWRWIDLDGDGAPGVLGELGGSWYYKRNLSPLAVATDGAPEAATARFEAIQPVQRMPSLTGGGPQFIDLAGDGTVDLVHLAGPLPGFYERERERGWLEFAPFTSVPGVPWGDPNLQLLDLSGDGHADILIAEDQGFTWHRSLGEAGFGPGERVAGPADEERGPRLVFNDGTQSIYLADLSGDGLSDLVRIRNGEVCYWPNLGYGRFGAKVAMDNAPWFDAPDQFDQRRVRLADVDGSGVTDILYLSADGVRLYLNESGNRWGEAQVLAHAPRVDNLTDVTVTDLLGNGTACVVWSSPLPGDGRRSMRYLDLMGGRKPHLLTRITNNLGTETRIRYAPSTRFYLQDRQRGRPWVTRLPFPVQVVERTETLDHSSGNRFVTRHAYHHGYFDGVEREFRGFGMVEQWDTEELAALTADHEPGPGAGLEDASQVPPVLTRTWFHTGAHLEGRRISRLFQDEYHREPGLDDDDHEAMLLADTELPAGLTAAEERQACRSLKGAMLRREVYALDGSQAEGRPYEVAERNYTIRLLQPEGANRHAVFFAHPREAVDFSYERALFDVGGEARADPRVRHTVTLAVDNVGNVLRAAEIGYGRRHEDPDPVLTAADRATQARTLLTCVDNDYTNAVDEADAWRTPLLCDTRTYELVRVLAAGNRAGITNLFRFGELGDRVAEASDGAHDLDPGDLLGEGATEDHPYRRLVERRRILYRADDLGTLLPLGRAEPMALPGESYLLAFTPDLLDGVFRRDGEALIPDRPTLLGDEAGLLRSDDLRATGLFPADDPDDHWWVPSGRGSYSPDPAHTAAQELAFARRHFFLTHRVLDPFGQATLLAYDGNDLSLTRTRDPLGNVVQARYDYRVLQPALVTDANRNRMAAAFDAFGMVTATAVMGKEGEGRGDQLEGFDDDPPLAQVQLLVADPPAQAASLLGKATTRIVHDLGRFQRTGQPVLVATLARETHVHDLSGEQPRIQVAFTYIDGLGRNVQKKVQAEPGTARQRAPDVALPNGDIGPGELVRDAQGNLVRASTPHRWTGTGRTVFNNKGKPVLQYQPFFSATHLYEPEPEMTDTGVAPMLVHDPVERVVATLRPNHTYEKVVFGPWRQAAFDASDTVAAGGAQTGDPRTDPDIAGFVRGYFAIQPADWQTWHAERIAGQLGPAELDAAQKAAAHADTPGVAHFDPLGRPFLMVVDNGPDPAQPGRHRCLATRVVLDIAGQDREIVDAGGRTVMRHDTNLLGTRVHQASMEAGERWVLQDAVGMAVRAWDSRGFERRMTYDELRRPTGLHVTENDIERLAERTVYGEAMGDGANHRTRVHQVFDGAGIVTSAAYDFKGNVLETRRELLPEYREAVDWGQDPVPDDGTFTSHTSYDALNRPLAVTTPDGSVYRPTFNEAGLLERAEVNLRGATAATAFVADIDYNAKGQRRRIEHGNGAVTVYERDPLSCRVLRLTTTRPAGADAMASQLFRDTGIVQDLHLTYDPIGNITRIEDAALTTVFHDSERVEPVRSYTYDAVYRLIAATGREHIGQTALAAANAAARDFPFAGPAANPNDLQALRNYTEQYDYDAAGNLERLRHIATDGGWTRRYDYEEASLLDIGQRSNRLTRTVMGNGLDHTEPYAYDSHGSVTSMPHLGTLDWDFQDRLHRVDLGGGGTAFFVYDASGERVRKVIESQSGTRRKERIYLGGFEVDREYDATGATVVLERESLQVADDTQRIALVETPTVANGAPVAAPAPLLRYQLVDQLDSSCTELDAGGALIAHEEYHPYGTTAFQAGRSAAEVSLKRYRHTGKERDGETGFSYHGTRYYAPWLGRWVSTDPSGIKGGLNLYAYGDANPVSKADRSGTDSEWCFFCNPFSDDVEVAPVEFLKEEVAPRAVGGLKAAAGFAGMVAGAALCKTGIGCVIGGPLFVVSADYGGSGLGQAIHGEPQPTVLGQLAGPKAQAVQEQVVEAAGLSHMVVTAASGYALRRAARQEAEAVAPTAAPEAPHVGASPTKSSQQARHTVADAGKDKCVGNVCAIMKNQELKASPSPESAIGYTVRELEQKFAINLGRMSRGETNPLVADLKRAIPTIERLTGLRAVNAKRPVDFALAKAEGQYAIFLNNEQHVIYARIRPGGSVSILDASVGKGWGSWSSFLESAKRNPTLYGPNPAATNQAVLFKAAE